jgi:alkanesulfonate monooxygenase SsuD/methylene tetrahydromethanopterin reductase-like flavin-dependent oxidoreductase (luciferase family)
MARIVAGNQLGERMNLCEAAGCEGTLVYTDNGLVDRWLVSLAIIAATERICPLIAVQAVYMHPYTAAKMAARSHSCTAGESGSTSSPGAS